MRVESWALVVVGAGVFGALACAAPGCGLSISGTSGGGDDAASDATPVDDGGAADGGVDETGADAAPDGDAGEADADASAPDASCGPDDTACGAGGLCLSGACASCVDVTDDVTCKSAYGGAYLCLGGACTPGDCRSSADCTSNPNGGLCGVTTPNTCGKCSSDAQCSASASTPVCDTTGGQCVAGTCTPNGSANPPAACPFNAMDLCCTGVCQPAIGAHPCCPGTDNGVSYCTTQLGTAASCVSNVCTACAPATGGQYLVDPVNGNDSAGTGASAPGCAFKTISRALQVVGAPVSAATITVIGPSTVGAGESFPLAVPVNTTVTTSSGAVTVQVPAGKAGFSLGAPNAALSGAAGATLTIDGSNNQATVGIVASTGSAASTRISGLTVRNFLRDGILVNGKGALAIGAGVVSTANGTATGRRAGLHVTATASAVVDVTSGQPPTQFDGNTGHGILVDSAGYVTITGSVTSATAGTGTVTANGNYLAGLWVQQNPTLGALSQNAISGLVAFGNTNGHGIRLLAGSKVKLRGSVALANANGNGVRVSTQKIGAAITVNDISAIDLGSVADPGHNTVQGAAGASNNGGAGICLDVAKNTGSLAAAGNTFRGTDCATTAGTLTFNKGGCGMAGCAGGICDLGVTAPGNDVTVNLCTHP